MTDTAAEVQRLREALGLTPSELAAFLGIHRATAYRWEAGATRPQPADLELLRRVVASGERPALPARKKRPWTPAEDGLVRSLSERVQEQAERVEVRICHELLRMARGAMINHSVARLAPPPKHLAIANRVNTHREAVTRLLAKLKEQGITQRGHGELLIKDVPALQAFARRLHGS